MVYLKDICVSSYDHHPFTSLFSDDDPPVVFKQYFIRGAMSETTYNTCPPKEYKEVILCSDCLDSWKKETAHKIASELEYLLGCIPVNVENNLPTPGIYEFNFMTADYMQRVMCTEFKLRIESGNVDKGDHYITVSKKPNSILPIPDISMISHTEVSFAIGVPLSEEDNTIYDLLYIEIIMYLDTILEMEFRLIPDDLANTLLINNTSGTTPVVPDEKIEPYYKYNLYGCVKLLTLEEMYPVVVQYAVEGNLAEKVGLAADSSWPTSQLYLSTTAWMISVVDKYILTMKELTSDNWDIIVKITYEDYIKGASC